MERNKAFLSFRKWFSVTDPPLYHPGVVIVAEHDLYGPDEQHVEGEDENAQKSNLVKKPPHVSNQSVGMANIDKSAEEDSQVRDSTYGI